MQKYTLLYVDDEESNLRIFRDTFRRDFNVFTALSAKEGIEILDNNKIDLVLSDQRMPEMTGVEFLKYSLEQHPGLHRILITGYSDMDAIGKAINHAHVFQYVQKPWNKDNLLAIINNALGLYKLEQENIKQREELIKAKEKAEQSDRLKTEFLQNMSHEIRTPMNSILGFSGFLNDPKLSPEKRSYYVQIIQNSGKQLLRAIDDILEISKLVTNQVTVYENTFCLNDLLLKLYSDFEGKAKERNISLLMKKSLSDSESTIITDDIKLKRAINNLLENALKFTNKGFVEFGYRLKYSEENNPLLEIYVKDTGVGIKPENCRIIFESFSQENKELSDHVGGLGLGLSIAKENVKLIGGRITLESKKGKGSVFYITIPYKPAAKNKKTNIFDAENDNKKNKNTILVVEDEELNYLFIEILLKRIHAGFNVLHAKHGVEAVEICKTNQNVDLVLMDLKMPIMDGYEAAQKIRKLKPNLPIVAQTAYTTDKKREKAFDSGCVDYITKPVEESVLRDIINKYVFNN
jgi:signal transduction histidine kinase